MADFHSDFMDYERRLAEGGLHGDDFETVFLLRLKLFEKEWKK